MVSISKDSLSGEIAILRLCVEKRLELATTNEQLLEQAPLIGADVMLIEKLIVAESRIQRERVKAIDAVMRTAADVAQELVGIVVKGANLSDIEINAIADKVASSIKAKKRRRG